MQWDFPHRQQLCRGSLTSLSSWGPSPCQEGPPSLFGSLLGLSARGAFIGFVRLARGFWFSPSASPLSTQPVGTACRKGASRVASREVEPAEEVNWERSVPVFSLG